MDSLLLEIGILIFLILLNGFFVLSEIALISARKSRLQHLAEEGNPRARLALDLASRPDQFLAAVQVGVTLIGILVGALSSATIAHRVAGALAASPVLAPYAESLSVAAVVILLTFFSVVLGELVPKQLALHASERLAMTLAGPMRILARLTSPLVRFLSGSANLAIRLLGIRPGQEAPVTPEEIKVLVEQGTQSGAIEEAEQDMVEGVFRLGEQRAGALMTPRPDVDWLDLDDSADAIRDQILHSHRTRFPVAQGDLDNLLGMLHSKDLLADGFCCDSSALRKVLRPAVFIPESTEALKVLEQFKRTGEHFAVVTDEFGSVAGVITSTDILETIVGDLPAAGEPDEPEVTLREDGTWLLGGALSVEEMKDLLELNELPDEDEASFQTVGGFVMSRLGEIPRTGNHFEWGGYRFEVVDMDGRRVDKVLVTKLPPEASLEGVEI
jgi:putative hemolysin